MKKILTLAFAASMMLLATDAFAQFHVGFGYTRTMQTAKALSSELTGDKNGVYAGVGYTLPIAGALGITPGVYYTYSTHITKNVATLAEHNVKGILDISYKLDLANDLAFFAFAGPRYSYGLSSTYKIDGVSETIDNYNNSFYKKGNFLLGCGVGVEFLEVVRFQVGYDHGLTNRYDSDLISLKENMINAGISLLF